MIDIVVEHAALTPEGGGTWTLAVQVTEDGVTQRGLHVMPVDALEWRIAEFNVDAETAAKIILTEQGGNVPVPNPSQALQPTRSAARNAKLARVDQVLDGGTITWAVGEPVFRAVREDVETIADSGDGDPLQTLIEASAIDDDLIAVKREWLDQKREGQRRRHAEQEAVKAEGRRAGSQKLRRPTPDQLRERLNPRQHPQAEGSGPADVRRGRER
jgi:hypothetical protein